MHCRQMHQETVCFFSMLDSTSGILMQLSLPSFDTAIHNFFLLLGTRDRCGSLRPVIRLHSCLSFASRTASEIVHPHCSLQYRHTIFLGLPRGRSPSTISSITVFARSVLFESHRSLSGNRVIVHLRSFSYFLAFISVWSVFFELYVVYVHVCLHVSSASMFGLWTFKFDMFVYVYVCVCFFVIASWFFCNFVML